MWKTVKCCIQGFTKSVLVVTNVIALLTGIALVGVGSYTVEEGGSFLPDIGVSVTPAIACAIVLGILLFLLGSFGCFGAITGKHSLLNVYLILLGMIVILELVVLVGIYGFDNRDTIKGVIEDAIKRSFDNVNKNELVKEKIDFKVVNTIQSHVKCCGVDGPKFWNETKFNVVPGSCCKDVKNDENCTEITDAYTVGCLSSTEDLVGRAFTALIVGLIAIVVFQLLCMVFAWCSREGCALPKDLQEQ